MTGLKRALADKVNRLLNQFPVVVILGVRQCGKTTFVRNLKPTWHYLDLEKMSDFEQISQDPEFYFERFPKDLIIDEAQLYPQLFSTLRGVIDQQRNVKGRYILTGSSSPVLLRQVSESLAGRVAMVEMGTLKMSEIAQQPLSSFYQLFDASLDKIALPQGKPPLSRDNVHKTWLRGGYPEPILSDMSMQLEWMEQYRNSYLNRDIAQLFPKLNQLTYQRFLNTLSSLSGSIVNRNALARAIEVSAPTIQLDFGQLPTRLLYKKVTKIAYLRDNIAYAKCLERPSITSCGEKLH